MAPSRTRTIGFVTAITAGALAVRPVAPLERALDLVLLPGRMLASLASPIGLVQAREGTVARALRAARDEADLEAHRGLEERVRTAAWPSAGLLAPTIGAVQAEVIGHVDADLDVLRLAVSDPERVRIGQPVIAGNAYVGRLTRIPGHEPPPPTPRGFFERLAQRLGLGAHAAATAPNEVQVELVTARDARVGARIDVADDGGPCRMVVGGLAPLPDALFLAVHNPERRAVASGIVRVHEPPAVSSEFATLAHGFEIGELRREQAPIPGADFTREVVGVRPYLDYEAGLHQVLVLVPDGNQQRIPERTRTVLTDGGWLAASFFVRAEPSPWREGRKLDRGRRHGVVAGSALTSGARLVGRVTRAGLVMSDVALPGDVGFSLSVLAEASGAGVTHDLPPLVLGRLVSRGRRADGTVEFAWHPQRPLDPASLPAGARAAGSEGFDVTLWTGSGEVGVPRGLLVGTTSLPLGPGPHTLHVTQPEGARNPRGLRVRTTAQRESAP